MNEITRNSSVLYVPSMQNGSAWTKQLSDVKRVVQDVSKIILEARSSKSLDCQEIYLENGKKVVQTSADRSASELILQQLSADYPDYGLLSQDHMGKAGEWWKKENIWMINAIDGTKEYEKGGNDFHIQIGLVHRGESVLGVSYYPATEAFVYAVKGGGAWQENRDEIIRLKAEPISQVILIKSSSHALIDPFFKEKGFPCEIYKQEISSSTSRLLSMIQGKTSLYVSLGASPKGDKKGALWNNAANDVIAKEAGLILCTLLGNDLDFRNEQALLPQGLILTTDRVILRHIIEYAKENWM